MQELAGKIIKKIEISDDQESIIFTTKDNQEIGYFTWGDCCSTSWFAHISGLKNLLDQEILSIDDSKYLSTIEKAETEIKQKEEYFDCLAIYGYDIYTKKGICTIEFRNDSNGYYGGGCGKSSRDKKAIYRTITKDF